ncbi:MAG: carboxypeptidase regulatory-like domain-containing protein [Planctomycetota bacterium]|nr:carboxypeptidase regulatory-like domain-containing protein [Planctomycetota bacterium]
MKKKQALTTILLIICGYLAYQLLRDAPAGGRDPEGDPRIENRAREEEKVPIVETVEVEKTEILPDPVKAVRRDTIAGRVVIKETTQPVAEAVISLLNDPGTKTATKKDGSFRLVPVAPQANDLLIRAPGYGVTIRPQVPGGTKELVILLEKELTLRGTTVFPDGRPAPNIELLLHSAATLEADPFSRAAALHGGRPAEARGTSDSQGVFSIGGLSQRDWFLRTRGPGIVEQVLNGVVWVRPEIQPIEVVVEPGLSITGNIVDEAGNSLPGLEVRVFAELDLNLAITLTEKTDNEGRFVLGGLSKRTFGLIAGASSDFFPIRIDQVEPGEELLIELARADSLNGRVIDAESSRPVEGAVIGWNDGAEDDFKELHGESIRETVSDEQGHFNLRGIPRGDVEFTARAEGYLMMKLDKTLRRNTADKSGPVLRMSRAGRVRGVARNEAGAPVAEARIELMLNSQNGLVLATGESDSEGRFHLGLDSTPKDEACTVTAQHKDYQGSTPVELIIEDPSREHPELAITLLAGGTISGKINFDRERLPEGLTLAGVKLMLLRVEEGELAELNRSSISDANGEYSLAGLAKGEYVLRSDSAGFSPYQSEPLRLGERESLLHEIFFTAERVVSGEVRNQLGEPLRATISARDLRNSHRKRSRRQTFSDKYGRFRLGSLGPGPYRVTAEAADHLPLTENSVSPPEESNFVLERYGWVEGEVKDDSTGNPLEDFSITILPIGETGEKPGRPRETVFENSGGRFFIGGLARGKYDFLLSANGYLPLIRILSISGEKISSKLDLKLSRGRSIELAVEDQEGRAIEGCRISVHLQVTGGKPPSTPHRSVFLTNDKGKARISGLATGSWTLAFNHPGYLPHQPLSLSLAEEIKTPPSLKVTLLSGASLKGKLSTPVISGRRDRLLLMGKNLQRQAEPDDNRNYVFDGLPPGTYTLLHYGNSRLVGKPIQVRIEAGAKKVILNIDKN